MKFGLVGCGWAGAARAEAMARLPGFRLVAVSDQDTNRARALAEKYRAAIEVEWEALTRREDLEAVLVSTPPLSHREMCEKAFGNGKHVFCEKPLARNPEECRQILDAAQQSGRLLATGFNLRFFPPYAKAREILDSGRIGELDHIRALAGHPGGQQFTQSWVHDVDVMGGGTLLDNGIHLIDLTSYFLGGVQEVKGYASGNVWKFPGCEDNGFALLKSSAGKIAVLHASWTEWRGYGYRIEIYGTRGCIKASYPPMLTRVVWMDKPGGSRRSKTYLFPKLQVIERLRSYRWTLLESFRQELQAFARAASGEKTPLGSGVDGLRAVTIAHAVYRSSRTGEVVRVDDLPT
jgi:predicted dehydrogenase